MKWFHRVWQAAIVVAVLFIAVFVLFHVKQSDAQQTNFGPFETDLSIGTGASMAAVAANPSRRGLIICNDHASQTINVTFGPASTPSATVGLRIPGGNAVASCWYSGSAITPGIGGFGAQINIIASGATTPVTVFEF